MRKGERFGRLVAVSQSDKRGYWHFACDCGRHKEMSAGNVSRGASRSCGCLRTELHRKRLLRHGHTTRVNGKSVKSAEYWAWHHAKRRCHSPTDNRYAIYGARGVRMCERWRASFDAFLADMGRRPSAKHSLDRIDVNGHYEPGNCRWALPLVQQNNRRDNVIIGGRTVSEIARDNDMRPGTIAARARRGLPTERVVSKKDLRHGSR